GGTAPQAGSTELGGRSDQPLGDHGQHQISLASALGRDERVEADLVNRAEDGLSVTVRDGALNGHELFDRDETFTGQDAAEGVDLFIRPVGQVRQGDLDDAGSVATSLAKKDSGARAVVGHTLDVHGNMIQRYAYESTHITWE